METSLLESNAGQEPNPSGWSYFDVVAIPEELTIDFLDAAHHLLALSPVGEKIEHTPVSKELIHVVEVPTAPSVDRRTRLGGELLGQGVDEDELLEERTSGMKHSNLEGLEVHELTEIRPGGFKHITE